MLNRILVYGLVGGLIVGVPLCTMVITDDSHSFGASSMAIGYLTMLIGLSTIFVAVKRHRDEALGGVIRFWPAFAMGLGISLVAGVVYVLSWETALAISQKDFARAYADAMIAQQQAAGVKGAELGEFTRQMREFEASYRNPLFRMAMTMTEILPVGLLVSLVAAALLRNPRFLQRDRQAHAHAQ